MSKTTPCPIQGPWPAVHRDVQISDAPWGAPGRTQMLLGVREAKTWNPTTKQFEVQARLGIAWGPTAEKRFRFGPSKLI